MEKIKEQTQPLHGGKMLLEVIPDVIDHCNKDLGNKVFGKN
jgi:hypothetical protein